MRILSPLSRGKVRYFASCGPWLFIVDSGTSTFSRIVAGSAEAMDVVFLGEVSLWLVNPAASVLEQFMSAR